MKIDSLISQIRFAQEHIPELTEDKNIIVLIKNRCCIKVYSKITSLKNKSTSKICDYLPNWSNNKKL